MKIKDDIQEKWDSGEWTLFDIAEHYHCSVENIMQILGLAENPFSYELH